MIIRLDKKEGYKMERLTYRIDGKAWAKLNLNASTEEQMKFGRKSLNKLCDYEDAEEQGLFLKLPCKIGTELWYKSYYTDDYDHKVDRAMPEWFDGSPKMIEQINKTLFFTPDEVFDAKVYYQDIR